jgi:hypothetical protein
MEHTTRHPIRAAALPAVVALSLAFTVAACGDDDGDGGTATGSSTTTEAEPVEPVIDPGDGGDYAPEIDPANFVADIDNPSNHPATAPSGLDGEAIEIDNPYMPLQPGSRWVYEGTDDGDQERVEVEVTSQRRDILGISAVVVRDTVTMDGELVEDTYDWFAQDADGNVWYLGEETAEYENGEVVTTEGSWEAGVDGAQPGIVMLAAPAVGDAYRQEYYEGEAEDMGEVIRTGQSETVAAGSYSDVLVTEDWTPLEPEVVEEKSYAPGVGQILEVKTAGGDARIELVSFSPGA